MDFETKVLLIGWTAMLVIVIGYFIEKRRLNASLKWPVIDGPAPLEPDDQGFKYVLLWMNHIIQDDEGRGAEVSMVYEWRGFVLECQKKINGWDPCCGDFAQCERRCVPLIADLRRQIAEKEPNRCVQDGGHCGVGGYCQDCQHVDRTADFQSREIIKARRA